MKDKSVSIKNILNIFLVIILLLVLTFLSNFPNALPNYTKILGYCTSFPTECPQSSLDTYHGLIINFLFWLVIFIVIYKLWLRNSRWSIKKFIVSSLILLLTIAFLRFQSFAKIGAIDIFVKKNYSNFSNAIDRNDYQKYPANSFFIPSDIKEDNKYKNSLTGSLLELDTSAGGGYKCCEQPTFYTYVDRRNNIFWIQDYSAGLGYIYEKWYGPFHLVK